MAGPGGVVLLAGSAHPQRGLCPPGQTPSPRPLPCTRNTILQSGIRHGAVVLWALRYCVLGRPAQQTCVLESGAGALGGAGPPQHRRRHLAAPHPGHSVPWQLFVQHLLVPSTGAGGQSEPRAACLSSDGFSGWKVSLCVNEAGKGWGPGRWGTSGRVCLLVLQTGVNYMGVNVYGLINTFSPSV